MIAHGREQALKGMGREKGDELQNRRRKVYRGTSKGGTPCFL